MRFTTPPEFQASHKSTGKSATSQPQVSRRKIQALNIIKQYVRVRHSVDPEPLGGPWNLSGMGPESSLWAQNQRIRPILYRFGLIWAFLSLSEPLGPKSTTSGDSVPIWANLNISEPLGLKSTNSDDSVPILADLRFSKPLGPKSTKSDDFADLG